MSNYPASRSCLCQQVAYEITGNLGISTICNGSRCRTFTGSAFASSLRVSPNDFAWLRGEDRVSHYALPEARHVATACCGNGGSSLPWRTQSGKAVVVPANTLDSDPQIRPMLSVFFASRADWYTDPDALPTCDELPDKRG